jgi:hypothetical protein
MLSMPTKLRTETTKIETTIRFAQVLDGRNKLSEEERRWAFQDAQAEGVSTFASLRTRILLEITNGNVPLVGEWLREFELGDFHDNCEALTVSLHRVGHGEIEHGLIGLCLLREHIVRSTEIKSSRHLLPVIDETIANIEVGLLEPAGNVTPRPESETSDELDNFPLFM